MYNHIQVCSRQTKSAGMANHISNTQQLSQLQRQCEQSCSLCRRHAKPGQCQTSSVPKEAESANLVSAICDASPRNLLQKHMGSFAAHILWHHGCFTLQCTTFPEYRGLIAQSFSLYTASRHSIFFSSLSCSAFPV